MASTAELAPLTKAQAAALRVRVLQLRAAASPADAEPLSARRVALLLAAEPAFAAFATAGRVKKLWKQLNAEAAGGAAVPPSPPLPPRIDPEATLQRWPAGASCRDALDKGEGSIFSLDEKLMTLSHGGELPQGHSADLDFRQSVLCLAVHWDAGVRVLFLQDEPAQRSALALFVRGAYLAPERSPPTPLFSVEWMFAERGSVRAAEMGVLLQAEHVRGRALAQVHATQEEQRQYWLPLLEHNTQPASAGTPCEHPGTRRSYVLPPPAAPFTLSGEAEVTQLMHNTERKQVLSGGPRLCACCHEAAALTCSRCKGVSYCAAACQLRHWPAHKAVCAKPSAAVAGESVVFSAAAAAPADSADAQVALNMSLRGRGVTAKFTSAAPANPYGTKRFLVKVQVPLRVAGVPGSGIAPGMPLSIYDEPRALMRLLSRHEQPEAFDAMAAVVQRHGVMSGSKAYLWAVREGSDVRVFTTPPDDQAALARTF